MMRRLVGAAACAAAFLVVCAGGAQAETPVGPALQQKLLGVVQPFLDRFAGGASGLGQLRYHGGPVMHTNATHAIYWVPAGYSVAPGYTTTIDQYLRDVAADSGKTSNVYWSTTQYTDGGGAVQYASSFAGSVVDTNPFPASGCTDSVAQTTVCLSDAQLQAEIQRVVAANGWPKGGSAMYFLFTPKNVGSCSGSSCAFSQFCAYHSWIGSGSNLILYANQPYTMTVPTGCDSKQHPNGNDADPTINVVSHEHAETITDEQGNAWYDLVGYENGDKCAWGFGTALGSTQYGQYNQLINGHPYYLQREYSNKTRSCVLTGL